MPRTAPDETLYESPDMELDSEISIALVFAYLVRQALQAAESAGDRSTTRVLPRGRTASTPPSVQRKRPSRQFNSTRVTYAQPAGFDNPLFAGARRAAVRAMRLDRKSTRLNSSH